jgi:hypothetical protein
MVKLTSKTCKECSELLYENNTSGLCKKHYRKWHYNNHQKEESKAARLWMKKFKEDNPEEYRKRQTEHARRCRTRVMESLGNRCECCGETTPQFLAIDHINGGGNKDRHTTGGAGFYNKVYKNVISGKHDYRILCHNCNHGRYLNGGICPHKMVEEGNNG